MINNLIHVEKSYFRKILFSTWNSKELVHYWNVTVLHNVNSPLGSKANLGSTEKDYNETFKIQFKFQFNIQVTRTGLCIRGQGAWGKLQQFVNILIFSITKWKVKCRTSQYQLLIMLQSKMFDLSEWIK